jgi:hypothetical protein
MIIGERAVQKIKELHQTEAMIIGERAVQKIKELHQTEVMVGEVRGYPDAILGRFLALF